MDKKLFLIFSILLALSPLSVSSKEDSRFGNYEEIKVDYALNKSVSLFGNAKYNVVVTGIPSYVDTLQMAKGTKSDSEVIGKRNKEVLGSANGAYAEFKIDLSEPDEDLFNFKSFRKTEHGNRIVDRFRLEIEVIKCPEEDDPVCADSGRYNFVSPKTYKNLCEYERAKSKNPKVDLLYEGKCQIF